MKKSEEMSKMERFRESIGASAHSQVTRAQAKKLMAPGAVLGSGQLPTTSSVSDKGAKHIAKLMGASGATVAQAKAKASSGSGGNKTLQMTPTTPAWRLEKLMSDIRKQKNDADGLMLSLAASAHASGHLDKLRGAGKNYSSSK